MGNSMTKERKYERLNCFAPPEKIVSERKYNLILGGTILYGLLINVLMCRYFPAVQLAESVGTLGLFIGYIVLTIAGVVISASSKNAGVSFLGYNLIVLPIGVMVTILVTAYGGLSSSVVISAFWYTGVITLIMCVAAAAFPRFFARIGGFLFAALIGLMVVGLLTWLIPGMISFYSIAGAVIFSLYIGYDMFRSQVYPKTADNAVDCAVDIYLDIINLFIMLLQIFGNRDR
ncbi:MAG: Bax inhibitor-1 family protein [Eubacterium sp.]